MRKKKDIKRIMAFVLSAVLLFSGVTITGAMDSGNAGYETVAEAGQLVEGTEFTENNDVTETGEMSGSEGLPEATEASESMENTETTGITETGKSTETTEAAETVESTESTETTETTEPTEIVDSTEIIESTETADITEPTESTEITESTETVESTESTEIPEETEADGNLSEYLIPEEELAVFSEPQKTLADNLEYEKTAHLTDWDDREYEIKINATSLASSEETVTARQTIDVMMVFDLSGSMNEQLSGENKLNDLGTYNRVSGQMEPDKMYYINTYEKGNHGNKRSTGMEKSKISGISYARYPVQYRDGKWQKYVNGQWSDVAANDTIATWDSKLTALKEAASGFVKGVGEKSPDSKIGMAVFYGITVSEEHGKDPEYATVGTLKSSPAKVSNGELLKAIGELQADGGTSPQKGLSIAKDQFDAIGDDGYPKYVILFSDGEPSEAPDRTGTETMADSLKEAGYTVITVGLGLTKTTADWLENKVASEKCAYTASNASELKKIFEDIEKTLTQPSSLYHVTIQDVIDSRFEVPEGEIARLRAEGAEVTVNEDGTTTIIWSDQEIKVEQDGKKPGWTDTIKVTAKEDYLGGNNVTTNVEADSKIRQGEEQVLLPQPKVNVKISYTIADTADMIFLGETLEKYIEGARTAICNGKTDAELMFYTDEACQNEISYEDLQKEQPKETTHYYVKAKLPVEASESEADVNSTINGVVYKNDADGVMAEAKEGKAYAGQYEIGVETGTLCIVKKISKNAVKSVEGDPIFTFRITNTTTGAIYYKTLRFNLESAKDTDGEEAIEENFFNVTAKTSLSGLPQGIYEVEELETLGFTVKGYAMSADTNCGYQTAPDRAMIAIGLTVGADASWQNKTGFSSEPQDGHLEKNLAVLKVSNKKTRASGKLTDTDAVKNHFVIGAPGEKVPDVDNNTDTPVWD